MQLKFQDKLANLISDQGSFLLFRQPNSDVVELWTNDSEDLDQVFIFKSFDQEKEIIYRCQNVEKINIDDLPEIKALPLDASNISEDTSYDDYIKLVSNTINYLQNTDTQKIVISRIKEIENNGVNLIKSFKNLHQKYPNTYLYLWYTNDNGVWIGASPELLLEESNLEIKTVSLAGTLPKNETWTDKEYQEQKVVTDYIVSKLTQAKDVLIEGPITIDAGFFNHLKSYITAKYNDYNQVTELLKSLHPTPAVCGIPTNVAKDYINQNEKHNRKFYTGYFGFKTPSKSVYFVNLRCAQIYSNKIKLYVGGGIMPNSNPQKEWEETELKSMTIGNLLVAD